MAYSWQDFRALVRVLLTDAQRTDETFTLAVAEFVKAKFSREISHDLDLHNSYFASYLMLRNRLLGYAYSGDADSLKAAVQKLISYDANRQGTAAFLDAIIRQGQLEIEGLGSLVEEWIRLGAMDVQSYIALYRAGQETSLDALDAEGMAGKGQLPEGAQLRDAYFIQKATGVAAIRMTDEGHDYTQASGTITGDGFEAVVTPVIIDGRIVGFDVQDSGRDYTQATIAIAGDGAGAVGVVVLGTAKTPMQPFDWDNRQTLICGKAAVNANTFYLAIDPWGKSFYCYPALDAQHKLVLTWDGVRLDFGDNDIVPFDEPMAHVVAEFVKGHFAREVSKDYALATSILKPGAGTYFLKRRRLYLDAQDRLRMRNA